MARMTAADMMGNWGGGARNPITGIPRPLAPSEVPQKPWNVKGDAGIPTGKNGDGDPMTGADCY